MILNSHRIFVESDSWTAALSETAKLSCVCNQQSTISEFSSQFRIAVVNVVASFMSAIYYIIILWVNHFSLSINQQSLFISLAFELSLFDKIKWQVEISQEQQCLKYPLNSPFAPPHPNMDSHPFKIHKKSQSCLSSEWSNLFHSHFSFLYSFMYFPSPNLLLS